METLRELVDDFLAQKRIAVAGVSRGGDQPANAIYRRLRDTGHAVFAVNPAAAEVEGDPCFPSLDAIPDDLDGVVVVTPPDTTEDVVRQCAELSIPRVWIHRGVGRGSASKAAVACCREHGIRVIPGGCPMMFCEPVDVGHKCMRWWLGVTGRLPK